MASATIPVHRDVLEEKKQQAQQQRRRWAEQGTLVINLVSSPGAGKTTLLQAMAKYWKDRHSMMVLVGDIATDRDAERLRPFVPVEQLTTGGACHLELPLVQQGLKKLPGESPEFLFIENIGNLVCPASHDLGEHLRVVLLSSTEGDDKPGKYPKMFRTSHALVISKSDLLPYVPFSVNDAIKDAHRIQPGLRAFVTSGLRDDGLFDFCEFLVAERERLLTNCADSGTSE
ncbi:MAG: hydrogenase nickel incorporation protein HypB [Planctomycetota bacterium]